MDASALFIDGTHAKASANKRKSAKEEVEISARSYQDQLNKEIDEDCKAHGKKPFNNDDSDDAPPPATPETKHVTKSTTYPECGMFNNGEHERQFAYTTGVACDKHN